MKNISTTTIIIAIVALGAGFSLGMVYQKGKAPKMVAFGNGTFAAGVARGEGRGEIRGGNQGNGQGAGRMNIMRPVLGEIISSDDKSITVKLNDGSSKIVLLSDSTSISKAADVQKTDLKVGEKVSVFGQTNSDGSVSAQNIQLNPVARENSPSSGTVQISN